MVDDNLTPAYNEKLLGYLFLCLAYELREHNEEITYQDPEWSDPETSFSIVMYRSGEESHRYCSACIEVLGGKYQRECGPVTTAYSQSKINNEKLKSRFVSMMETAENKLKELTRLTAHEHFFLGTTPAVRDVFSTNSEHIVILQAKIRDNVDRLGIKENLHPWADYERIRDYFSIGEVEDGVAEIKVVFFKKKKQKKFVRYLKNLGVEVF